MGDMLEERAQSHAMEILEKALLHRSSTVAELADLIGEPESHVRASLHEIDQLGFATIKPDGQGIAYRQPDLTMVEAVRSLTEQMQRGLRSTFEQTDRVLSALPALSQAWYLGESGTQSIRAELVRGPDAPVQAWRQHFARHTPELHKLCISKLAQAFSTYTEPSSPWVVEAFARLDTRLLITVEDGNNPLLAGGLALLENNGAQIRTHPRLPGMFWVSDDYLIGIPTEWGEGWGDGVLTAKSPPLAKLLDWVFERYWQQALPLGSEAKSWDPLLMLVAEGMTIEAASQALGLTPRTGRRRVAAAMRHYGVHSQFALGRAWGADRSVVE